MNALTPPLRAVDALAPLHSVSRSHVGLVRSLNEDRVFSCAEAGLWAIADGMGGHSGGDIAAQIVVDTLRNLVCDMCPIDFDQVLAALQTANSAILARNERDHLEAGATVVVAFNDGAHIRIAWAGDSRAYLVGESTKLLTHDHSVVQELIDAGLINSEAALSHPHANVITRALGVSETLTVDTVNTSLDDQTLLILCSDGLSRTLAEVQRASDGIEALADRLIANALSRDGSDNISFVLIENSADRQPLVHDVDFSL